MGDVIKKNKYLFVSNVDIRNRKGGWDGLGGKIFDLLGDQIGPVQLLDNINPEIGFLSKATSKLFRKIGFKANFPAFSKSRLNAIARTLSDKIPADTDYIIFHGSTPWINYQLNTKYCALLDCSFITYMQVYHQLSQYSKSDIGRIRNKERTFFKNAHCIFFTSTWALQETCKHYELSGENFKVIGQGPSTEVRPPKNDLPVKDQFLFIATDFLGKGGAEVCNSFEKFLTIYPDYELVIVGQQPPKDFLLGKNIQFLGYINKSTPEGMEQLENLYRQSKALLMMTRKDIAPLVIIEAGLYGCPCIGNNASAIGEMIKDKQTGVLINSNEQELLQAMLLIAGMKEPEMQQMRKQVREFMLSDFSWKEIIRKMTESILKR
jgi:glycosyltransferase involved in cell wall biosynthesis